MFKDIKATIEIDLLKSEDELFNGADKDARWGIKKAEKEGIIIDQTEKEEDLERFYDIYKKTIIFGGIAPDSIKKLKNSRYRLFVAKKDGDIIAGAIIDVENNEKFKLEYNASLSSFLKFQPNNLLYWTLIKWGKINGYKTFDLGGYQINAHGHLSGVNKFKERWGGEIREYEIKSWNPIYILGRKIIRNFPVIKRLKDKIKLGLYLLKDKYNGNSIKDLGLSEFFKKVFNKCIYNSSEIALYCSTLSENKIINPRVSARFNLMKRDEALQLLGKPGLVNKKIINDRFDDGDLCFVYLVNESIAHFSWVGFKDMKITEINTNLPLEKNEAYIFDCFTDEKYRGYNLYPSMLTKVKDYLKSLEFSKAYIYVRIKNYASIRGIEKAGFNRIENIKHFKAIFFNKTKKISIK